jgi:hypothetical protein
LIPLPNFLKKMKFDAILVDFLHWRFVSSFRSYKSVWRNLFLTVVIFVRVTRQSVYF